MVWQENLLRKLPLSTIFADDNLLLVLMVNPIKVTVWDTISQFTNKTLCKMVKWDPIDVYVCIVVFGLVVFSVITTLLWIYVLCLLAVLACKWAIDPMRTPKYIGVKGQGIVITGCDTGMIEGTAWIEPWTRGHVFTKTSQTEILLQVKLWQ